MEAFKGEEDTIDSLYLALVQCFAIILCGYIAGRLNVISRPEANGLNTFVGTFSLPALIFLSLAKLDFVRVNWKFLLAVLIAKSLIFIAVLIVSLISTKPCNSGRSALFAIFTTQSNDFAIGYPMLNALYGATHPEYSAYLYLMAPISLAILNPIGFILLEIEKSKRNDEQTERLQMFKAVVKGVALNPVLLMTILGIIGNLIFKHNIPPIIESILSVFGNAFSASALFLLGLMMVGKVHKLKGPALVIPGILISIKLLVLPLVIRQSIILLHAGENSTETSDLSTFGFLYGTIPTAPALFIFTLRYNIDIDLIASAMVVCTFLSAPLMFISAKLITAVSNGITPANYARELKSFSLDTSAASVAACLWLIICFIVLNRKRFKSITHQCTICLILAQLATGVGVIIWTKIDTSQVGTFIWYLQFILITAGIYASRLWTAAIAATLLFLSSQTLGFVTKLQKWFYIVGWGLPFAIVGTMCTILTPKAPLEDDLKNPNFQFGRIQVALSILLLVFCFVVTLGCLVLRQRYQRRNSLAYPSLIPPPVNTFRVNRTVVDVEDLVSPATSISGATLNNDCGPGLCDQECAQECDQECNEDNENETLETEDPQILRHLVFLILLLCSMFTGLALSVGTLIMEQMTGVYTEMAFLDAALGFGQSLIAFAIFGLDPGLGKVGCWLRKKLMEWRIERELQLPDEDSLSPEIKAIRDQFRQCHLAKCQARIACCRRRLLRVYKEVFTGRDFVNWLLEAGIARNREEAVCYGKNLIDSRVLNHVDRTEHFHDRNHLYTFRP